MTSKTELKELILSLRDEIRELKTEIEVLKITMVNNNHKVVYPFKGTSEPIKYTPYVPSKTTGEIKPICPTRSICDSSTNIFKSHSKVSTKSDYNDL